MNPKIKNILIFAAIFGIIAIVYAVFFRKPAAPALVSTSGAPVEAPSAAGSAVGQEFLSLLLNIRNIKLDDAIFSKPSLRSLQDYTITLIPEGNEGRENPFAPIGVEDISPSVPTITTGS